MQLNRSFYLFQSILSKVAISLIIGTIIQALFFSGYGWHSAPGIIMATILFVRSRNLIINYEFFRVQKMEMEEKLATV